MDFESIASCQLRYAGIVLVAQGGIEPPLTAYETATLTIMLQSHYLICENTLYYAFKYKVLVGVRRVELL